MPPFADTPGLAQSFEKFTAGNGGRQITTARDFNVFHVSGGLHFAADYTSSALLPSPWFNHNSNSHHQILPPSPFDHQDATQRQEKDIVLHPKSMPAKDDAFVGALNCNTKNGVLDESQSQSTVDRNDQKSNQSVLTIKPSNYFREYCHPVEKTCISHKKTQSAPHRYQPELRISTNLEPEVCLWHPIILYSDKADACIRTFAKLEDCIAENWISDRIFQQLKLHISGTVPPIFSVFNGKTMKSTGAVSLTWFEESSYKAQSTTFQVTATGLFDVVFGRKVLNSGRGYVLSKHTSTIPKTGSFNNC